MNFSEFPRLNDPGLSEDVQQQLSHRLQQVRHRFRFMRVVLFIALCFFVVAGVLKITYLVGSSIIVMVLAIGLIVFGILFEDRKVAGFRDRLDSDYRHHLANLSKADLLGALSCRYELSEREISLIEEVLSEQHPGWSAELPGYPATTCPKCGSTCGSEGEGTHA
ncbi:MAG: hypothetical protein AWU57_48 [Marinobacter sp. T13-3]|nr:MAG: hypothetical protein AWU57_48 [Marinobacter sp. T13-3]